jgi:cytochrome c biogenesis protein CcdA
MLLVGYFSHFFRQKFRVLSQHPLLVRVVGAILLGGLGILLLTKGMVGIVVF